jgi:DNA helicase HerA-like ATPase
MSIFTPSARILARPDLRGITTPHQSGVPLSEGEIDYDDLVIHRAWREFEHDRPGEVRYFMYHLSQRDVGAEVYQPFYKAVRFLRVTRVPRYLRELQNSNAGTIFAHHRKVLAGLRERDVLFINLVAKSPKTPLIFAYGVQAVGATPEAAQAAADESYTVLQYLIEGVYQQLEYAPLTLDEGEALVRYQNEWRNIAMARGRPKPLGADAGIDAWLDGNRTDVSSTQNMLESFVRGMGERSFVMNMITVPVSPFEMTLAWRNMARRLSDVRSEQSGSRSVNAGVALPLAMSSTIGDTHGSSHTTGQAIGSGSSSGVSQADTVGSSQGVALSEGQTIGSSVARTEGASLTDSVNQSVSGSQTVGVTDSVGQSQGLSYTDGITVGRSLGQSESLGQSFSQSETLGQSVGTSTSFGENISQSAGQSVSASQGASLTQTDGWNSSSALGMSQAIGLNSGINQGISGQSGSSTGSGISGGLLGFGGRFSLDQSNSFGTTFGNTDGLSNTLTSSGTNTFGQSSSLANSLNQSFTQGQSIGQSYGQSLTQGQSFGQSHAVGQSSGQSYGVGQTATNSMGTTSSESQSQGLSAGRGLSTAAGLGESAGSSRGFSVSASDTVGQSQATSASTTVNRTDSVSSTSGTAQALMANQAASDSYVAALTRSAQNGTSLGVVPNVGISFGRNIFNEGKRVLGDMLEAQMNRYIEGVESGAFLYQLFLVCPDRETLAGASGLLKSSFWGPGSDQQRLPQPFHVVADFENDERDRLLTHAAAWTSYRKREYSTELIEPYEFSTYLTPSEGAAMTYPPSSEGIGLIAQTDSMPVFAMPFNRSDRDVYLGHIINGERARVSNQRYGLDLEEINHMLVSGMTGSGKTTFLQRFLFEATRATKQVVDVDIANPGGTTVQTYPAGGLVLDWAQSFRGLAATVPADRFQLFSASRPELGQFRFNLLALPDEQMNPVEWANTVSDLFMVSFGLGEFARSIFYEHVAELYAANRLEDYVLRPAVVDADGVVLRPADILPAIDQASLPAGAVMAGPAGDVANVHTYPALSRLVSLEHLATLVAHKVEELATPEGARLYGQQMRDRIQTVWRRVMAFAPGGPLASMCAADPSLTERRSLQVTDLVDPDRGLVTVIEADGLDMTNRRLILGGVLMSLFRYGYTNGPGTFDHGGKGPGTFVLLEEAHELFGSQGDGEDRESAATRVAIYESLFRRARQLGLRLIAAVQNPSDVPIAISSNVGAVVALQTTSERDKEAVAALFNWINGVGQQFREIRYLGEMAIGHCVIRLRSREHFLEAAPVHVAVDAPELPPVTDAHLATLAQRRA